MLPDFGVDAPLAAHEDVVIEIEFSCGAGRLTGRLIVQPSI